MFTLLTFFPPTRYLWIKHNEQYDIKEGPITNFMPKIETSIDAAFWVPRRSTAYLIHGNYLYLLKYQSASITTTGSQFRGCILRWLHLKSCFTPARLDCPNSKAPQNADASFEPRATEAPPGGSVPARHVPLFIFLLLWHDFFREVMASEASHY